MNVVGVVGEWNPFHRGHLEHFRACRLLAGEEAALIGVMSGDFVQRASPAVLCKQARAETAVLAGADLVFELPIPWCIASAETFALGAVGILSHLGVVTHLCFGSEVGDIAPLQRLSQVCADPAVLQQIQRKVRAGMAFAPAREAVLAQKVGPEAAILRQPNNILGVEYCKALDRLHSSITPMTTHRTTTVHDRDPGPALPGAAVLRERLLAGEEIAPYVPDSTVAVLAREQAAGRGPVSGQRLDQAVMARLRMLKKEDFAQIPDGGQGLGLRLYQAVRSSGDLASALERAGTKSCPTSRLRRVALYACLGIRPEHFQIVPPYARVLAFSPRGRELLRRIHPIGEIPLVTKPSSGRKISPQAAEILELTAAARDFYVLGYQEVEERIAGTDWRAGPVILENG